MLTDAEQEKLIQEFGYHRPDPPITTADATTAVPATRTGAASTAASTGAELTTGGIHAKLKPTTPAHKVKHRALKERSSDPCET